MNLVFLRGNLTNDPQLDDVETSNGMVKVVNFTIAVNRSFSRADGQRCTGVDFIPCTIWDSGAVSFANMATKGSSVFIEGILKSQSWETNGQKRSKVLVRVSHFDILNKK